MTRIDTIAPNSIGKRVWLVDDRKLGKGGKLWLAKGTAFLETVASLSDFAELLKELEPGQSVLTYGIPKASVPEAGLLVLSKGKLASHKWRGDKTPAIARSREDFTCPDGPGIALLDHDPDKGKQGKRPEDLVAILAEVCPELGRTQSLWLPSSSSHIHITATGEDLTGLRGLHGHIMFEEASDTSRAMMVLHKRLWLAGYGEIRISGSGQLLERGLFDTAVWQPERLDFAAGAKCSKDLEQKRGEPVLLNHDGAPLFDSRRALPDLSEADEAHYRQLVREAKAAREAEGQAVRGAWVDVRLENEIRRAHPELGERRVQVKMRKAQKRRDELIRVAKGEVKDLSPQHLIHLSENEVVSVAEILNDPQRYKQMPCCDPIEPDYRDWARSATIFAEGGIIYSHAHGAETRYRLGPQELPDASDRRVTVDLTDPDMVLENVQQLERLVGEAHLAFAFGGIPSVLRRMQSAYARVPVLGEGGLPMRDKGGVLVTAPTHLLQAEPLSAAGAHLVAADVARFVRTKRNNEVLSCHLCAPYPSLMAKGWGERLPPLRGFASYPVWHAGELLVGDNTYHADTCLMLQTARLNLENFDSVEDALKFLRDAWLADFPFAAQEDLSGALMVPISILMAKTTLSNAMGPPLFLITAPSAGTGKSLLAMGLIAAVTGELPPSTHYPDKEEEREKRITAAIMEGHPALFLDNLKSGSFLGRGDVALTKLITDVVWSGRVLGQSKMFKGPAGIVTVATGNNVVVDGDMARRTINIRLDLQGEIAARREFKHPHFIRWTLDNRSRILGALVKILQNPMVVPRGNIGGFPEWSAAVAQPILSVLPADGFFEPWLEASEEDGKGVQLREGYPLVQALSSVRVGEQNGVFSINGGWFTAAEAIDHLNDTSLAHLLVAALRENEVPTAKALAFLLRRSAGVTYEGDLGSYRVETVRQNLGARTDRKIRPVFRIKRLGSSAGAVGKVLSLGDRVSQANELLPKNQTGSTNEGD
ncbi:hypothetical protein CX676_07725 [Paracoccus zhejiangensis]|uniref:Uncharacterized protein n=1 Tax=Paracoccus zhejiangensis TaxID=1077935 RepID=A0A2H5EXM5_9RHOB|nr:hypothetical protein CX676_07725 [Paracoccus zhejiangensis]